MEVVVNLATSMERLMRLMPRPEEPEKQTSWMIKSAVIKLLAFSLPDPNLPTDTSYKAYVEHLVKELVAMAAIYGTSEKTEFPEDELFLHPFRCSTVHTAASIANLPEGQREGLNPGAERIIEVDLVVRLDKIFANLINQAKFDRHKCVQKATFRGLMRPLANWAFEYLKEYKSRTNIYKSHPLVCSRAPEVSFDFADSITVVLSTEQKEVIQSLQSLVVSGSAQIEKLGQLSTHLTAGVRI
ncbi:putative coat protein [Citrus yellow spot virus]|nr:putative coat protein [Citrus yellow spot virus]